MDQEELNSRLSRIETQWTMLHRAHGQLEDAVAAQRDLVDRYQRPIYRYLLAALRSAEAADELFQEFAVRLLEGRFRHASPEKGKFRAYLKTTLIRMVLDYRRRKSADFPLAEPAVAANESAESEASTWDDSWRSELLARAWNSLAAYRQTTTPTLHQVLWHRSQNPQSSSQQMAEALSAQLGLERPISEAHFRKILQRARLKFADVLLDELSSVLETDDIDRLEQELIDLQLHGYCRSALQRRRAAE